MSDLLVEHQRLALIAAQPVLADLAGAGYDVDSISALRTSGVRYRAAIPVLLRWLPVVENLALKQEIVRAVSVPWARPDAARPLIGEFWRVDPEGDPSGASLRWAIGNALEVVGDDTVFDEMVAIAENRELGTTRQMVVLGLGKSKRSEAVGVLVSLLDDADVSGHAVKALGKLRAEAARPALEGMVEDPRSWVRKEVKKALARLG